MSIGELVLGGGGVMGAVSAILNFWNKHRHGATYSQVRLTESYATRCDALEKRQDTLENKLDDCERKHDECLSDRITLREKISALERRTALA